MSAITFIVPVSDHDQYQRYFLSSPLFDRESHFEILAQAGFRTSGQAYNDGIQKAQNDLIVCAHQDVVLPAMWATRFLARRSEVESSGVPVGVVGCWGRTRKGDYVGHIYHRDRELFPQRALPARVQTLDELLISFRKSSGLRFDPDLPSFFGYAVDLCLQAQVRGLHNFVVDAPCIHQTADRNSVQKDMYKSWMYLLRKWKDFLPVWTPSGRIDGRWSYWKDLIIEYAFHAMGYSPRPWWLRYPQVNREAALCGDVAPTKDRD